MSYRHLEKSTLVGLAQRYLKEKDENVVKKYVNDITVYIPILKDESDDTYSSFNDDNSWFDVETKLVDKGLMTEEELYEFADLVNKYME